MMRTCAIDTPAKRSRLRPRKNPYWLGISGGRGGLSLGFRRTIKGEGICVAKIVIEGQRIGERIGTANGDQALPGALSFTGATEAALTWGKQRLASVRAAGELAAAKEAPTVLLAVETSFCLNNPYLAAIPDPGAAALDSDAALTSALRKYARSKTQQNEATLRDCLRAIRTTAKAVASRPDGGLRQGRSARRRCSLACRRSAGQFGTCSASNFTSRLSSLLRSKARRITPRSLRNIPTLQRTFSRVLGPISVRDFAHPSRGWRNAVRVYLKRAA